MLCLCSRIPFQYFVVSAESLAMVFLVSNSCYCRTKFSSHFLFAQCLFMLDVGSDDCGSSSGNNNNRIFFSFILYFCSYLTHFDTYCENTCVFTRNLMPILFSNSIQIQPKFSEFKTEKKKPNNDQLNEYNFFYGRRTLYITFITLCKI